MSTKASALSGAIAGGASMNFNLSTPREIFHHDSNNPAPIHACTGVSRLLTAPFDVVKIRFQLQVGPIASTADRRRLPYTSVWAALRKVAREEGVLGLWR